MSSRLLSERFLGLQPSVPGEQPKGKMLIKLNTNESPYPPPEGLAGAICREEIDKLRLYCDPECRALKEALAEHLKLDFKNIFVGNGSDEVLSFCFMAFCDLGAKVSYPDISYGFYPVYARLYGLESKIVPLRDDFTIDPEGYYNAGAMVVIANPNAPTGISLSLEDIEKIVKRNPNNIVVVDEAYVDFGAQSCVCLTQEYENLIVVQTFSKSRSLAGARLGLAAANENLINDLEKLRYSTNPYNVNSLTQLAGIRALKEQSYYDSKISEIIQTREETAKKMAQMGFVLTDSKANFLFARHPKFTGRGLYAGLYERGILVRHFEKPRISDYIRITVGTPEQMDTLQKELKEMVENAQL